MSDPLFRRLQQHAAKRLAFPPGTPQADRLTSYKEYLRLENEMLQRYHRKGESGTRVAKVRSCMMDVLLTYIFNSAIATYEQLHGKIPCDVSIVALGGYGREELCPFSDVDLMFLYPKRAKPKNIHPFQEFLTNEILYPLWDLNLKVGHSSRTIKQCLEEAKANIQTKNALLECRLVCGSEPLFQDFRKEYRDYYRKTNQTDYVQARLRDQAERREKYGGTVFVQEPDIKNGVGGLRDYHNILWMAEVRLGVNTLEGLRQKNYLGESEEKQLRQGYDFLLRVRNELHFQSTRATDFLALEKQPAVAWSLGYRQKDVFQRVEAFMHDYYRYTHRIYTLSRILEERLAITGMPGSEKISLLSVIQARRSPPQRRQDGFILRDKVLSAEHPRIFVEDPVRLIRVFRYAQQYEAKLGWDLRYLITDSLNLIQSRLLNNEQAQRCFRSILQEKGQVYPVLLEMHELGVLGRFIPEFGKLSFLVQHELYHRYTADFHTLETIRELDDVFQLKGEYVHPYAEALKQTEHPTLLYPILLVHDLAKGYPYDTNPDLGVRLAKTVLTRMGIPPAIQKIMLPVVKNHMEMARFWQRRDIDDPITANQFAELAGDEECLRYLYVFTYCDTRGTARSLWNNYKDALHNRLYRLTLEVLQDAQSAGQKRSERKNMIYKEILQSKNLSIPEEEVEAHFNLLPERYFLFNTQREIELHLGMVHELLARIAEAESIGSLVPVIDWRDDRDQNFTVISVVTWDRAGLFYKLAGALSVAGVNILSAKAISRNDHIAIDTFYVVDPNGGVVQNAKSKDIFKQSVYEALIEGKELLPQITEQAKRLAKPGYLQSTPRLKVPIPASVDVYHELSLKRTIIEIQASDYIGLLYQLTKAIYNHGFDISFARVSTERGAAIDTFYVEKIEGQDFEITERLISLREALNRIVTSEQPQGVT